MLCLIQLKETGVVIQLADRSNAYPRGVLEDVLVQVNEFVFPADFYVLDMEDHGSPMPTPLLLWRPFMKTARTKIDVYNGTLTMEFDGEIASFQVLEDKGNPILAMLLMFLTFLCSKILRGPTKKMREKMEKDVT